MLRTNEIDAETLSLAMGQRKTYINRILSTPTDPKVDELALIARICSDASERRYFTGIATDQEGYSLYSSANPPHRFSLCVGTPIPRKSEGIHSEQSTAWGVLHYQFVWYDEEPLARYEDPLAVKSACRDNSFVLSYDNETEAYDIIVDVALTHAFNDRPRKSNLLRNISYLSLPEDTDQAWDGPNDEDDPYGDSWEDDPEEDYSYDTWAEQREILLRSSMLSTELRAASQQLNRSNNYLANIVERHGIPHCGDFSLIMGAFGWTLLLRDEFAQGAGNPRTDCVYIPIVPLAKAKPASDGSMSSREALRELRDHAMVPPEQVAYELQSSKNYVSNIISDTKRGVNAWTFIKIARAYNCGFVIQKKERRSRTSTKPRNSKSKIPYMERWEEDHPLPVRNNYGSGNSLAAAYLPPTALAVDEDEQRYMPPRQDPPLYTVYPGCKEPKKTDIQSIINMLIDEVGGIQQLRRLLAQQGVRVGQSYFYDLLRRSSWPSADMLATIVNVCGYEMLIEAYGIDHPIKISAVTAVHE